MRRWTISKLRDFRDVQIELVPGEPAGGEIGARLKRVTEEGGEQR